MYPLVMYQLCIDNFEVDNRHQRSWFMAQSIHTIYNVSSFLNFRKRSNSLEERSKSLKSMITISSNHIHGISILKINQNHWFSTEFQQNALIFLGLSHIDINIALCMLCYSRILKALRCILLVFGCFKRWSKRV